MFTLNTAGDLTMNTMTYDVAICGGGLAGSTLARQLKLTMPDISIIVFDRLARPLPEGAFKVGESTVEVGSYYLAEILQFGDNYFKLNHMPKLGLRFFLGDAQGKFEERPELGLSKFHSPSSYQIDRGKFENDLRNLNIEAGIEVLESCKVLDIILSENNQDFHEIVYTQDDTKEKNTIQAKWVIDAMGRRRFLQKKLGLAQRNSSKHSAVWFWVNERVDVSDFVPKSNQNWHERVPGNQRYYSTNHLCGKGYWIWMIPLPGNYTSIGIVTDETVHPFGEHNTEEKALNWLQTYEPTLANHLQGISTQKFMKMPHYSYSSKQVFSNNRWACVGEAGVFPDPFYSPGTDLIGFGNSLVTQMIEADLQGKLTSKIVAEANRFLLTYAEGVKENIHKVYSCFDKDLVMTIKVIWDILSGWAFSAPLMFNSIFLDSEKRAKICQGSGQFFLLAHRMQKLFIDWAELSENRGTYGYIDYLGMDFIKQWRSRNLQSNKTEQQLIDDHIASLEIFEELAQVIFRMALEDTMPEKLADFPESAWLNAWAISLNEHRWEKDGLFRPRTQPRDLHPMTQQLRQKIHFHSVVKQLVTV
ncbi:MAG: FAD-dependent oxidoreductase [Moorea sp. SIO3F7]|nr:FAD-dependent oxidoreductase [Moorena sp. SIO3E8]NEP98461.1 FAD-dependent oxidoreductase [Moorena sp. SIO3F7]